MAYGFALDQIIKIFEMVEKHVLGNSPNTKDYHTPASVILKHNTFTTFCGRIEYVNLACSFSYVL
jgi:hypothetical protein